VIDRDDQDVTLALEPESAVVRCVDAFVTYGHQSKSSFYLSVYLSVYI
jgi:hypothetical protein